MYVCTHVWFLAYSSYQTVRPGFTYQRLRCIVVWTLGWLGEFCIHTYTITVCQSNAVCTCAHTVIHTTTSLVGCTQQPHVPCAHYYKRDEYYTQINNPTDTACLAPLSWNIQSSSLPPSSSSYSFIQTLTRSSSLCVLLESTLLAR